MHIVRRNILSFFPLLFALPISADETTGKQRERLVAIVSQLEKSPFSDDAIRDRTWALSLLDEAKDIQVTINSNLLKELLDSKAPNREEIFGQFILGAGRFVIQHPNRVVNDAELNFTAFQSCLHVYQKAVQKDSANKIEFFETLLRKQREKTLQDYVKQLVSERKPDP